MRPTLLRSRRPRSPAITPSPSRTATASPKRRSLSGASRSTSSTDPTASGRARSRVRSFSMPRAAMPYRSYFLSSIAKAVAGRNQQLSAQTRSRRCSFSMSTTYPSSSFSPTRWSRIVSRSSSRRLSTKQVSRSLRPSSRTSRRSSWRMPRLMK